MAVDESVLLSFDVRLREKKKIDWSELARSRRLRAPGALLLGISPRTLDAGSTDQKARDARSTDQEARDAKKRRAQRNLAASNYCAVLVMRIGAPTSLLLHLHR